MIDIPMAIAAVTVPAAAVYCVHRYMAGWQALERDRRVQAEEAGKLRQDRFDKMLSEFEELSDRVNTISQLRGA